MTTYWCVNFDTNACLSHGLDNHFWMMQYQYADDAGNEHQGDKKNTISRNWNRLEHVRSGDWFVAYLPIKRTKTGKPFFAVGKVITPRIPRKPKDHSDTIQEYLNRRRSHDHKSGYVYYTPVLYENFNDKWRDPDNKVSRYPQRIDVEEWLHQVPEGISVPGLQEVPRHETVNAVFRIAETYFDQITAALKGVSAKAAIPEEVVPSEKYAEGAVKTIIVNAYERNRVARSKCIEHHGLVCGVCGLSMSNLYGDLGEGVIHVHHLRELASLGKQYFVDPIKDLRPVCPNCHAILHITSPSMTIRQLKKVLAGREQIQWPLR